MMPVMSGAVLTEAKAQNPKATAVWLMAYHSSFENLQSFSLSRRAKGQPRPGSRSGFLLSFLQKYREPAGLDIRSDSSQHLILPP